MSDAIPRRAMVLAAGRGERMRPITEHTPKPMIEVRGEALIDRILDGLAEAGVEEAVVNLHHLADRLRQHLAGRRQPEIHLSEEAKLLDTGGGVANALARLGDEPFFVVNGDVLWLDGVRSAYARLGEAWDDERMDALLLLQPSATAFGYDGKGDFMLDPLGQVSRRPERETAPFVNAGVQIVHPRLFKDAPKGAFSFNLLWDRAIEAGRLWGLRHEGSWYHVGTPAALKHTEALLEEELGPLRRSAA